MNVLLIGSGGREHALAWALTASPMLGTLHVCPGNAGIAEIASCSPLDASDHAAVIAFCRANTISFVVIGPEAPLVGGLGDSLTAAGIKHFGPSAAAARLEGSKAFTKELCREANIPTAAYARFTNAASAKAYVAAHFGSALQTASLDRAVASQSIPIVVKADGLAAGKGVVVATTRTEANAHIDACLGGALGSAGAEVVVEAFLDGEEASFFALCDGTNVLALATAQDHKRVGDGDTGPNTGGMGAYSPAPVMTPAMVERTMAEIIRPTAAAMAARGTPFRGVLFAGLMISADGPQLIEYNVRFGDPECQVLMMRLKSDLLAALIATADGVLDRFDLRWHDDAALTVVMAADGYPGTPQTGVIKRGTVIRGLNAAAKVPGVEIFHAGTTRDADGQLIADGGRVLNITARGKTVAQAQQRAYQAIDLIDWPEGFNRRDIGWRAVERG
ncbi:MAG: phosphoribosylamine--glycine ligase [Hyphomicrobium aestuarii]|nr:phosphoribosylamine--glycine ligase [Hyphomicrobium aestuarii]